MKISDRLRDDAGNIWKSIIEHPFVAELCDGTLPMEKFKFYILQDYNYLIESMRNFSIISSRTEALQEMKEVLYLAYLESQSELSAYEEFVKKIGCTIDEARDVEPIPVAVSYVSYLLSTSTLKSYEESIASVLPCYWSYMEIARHYQSKLKMNQNKLYTEWASVYSLKSYRDMVTRMRNLVDNTGENFPYKKLKRAFITASRYEYMYWDAVYNMIDWPV
ncbi:thiaminase II [bacterium]|nr:thiaminase II [bacterium]